jgi:hypothetical protein
MQSDSAASLNPHANIAERPHGRSGTVGTAVPFRFVGPAIAVQIGSSETGKALRRPIDGPLRDTRTGLSQRHLVQSSHWHR